MHAQLSRDLPCKRLTLEALIRPLRPALQESPALDACMSFQPCKHPTWSTYSAGDCTTQRSFRIPAGKRGGRSPRVT